jgi:hypothetical protein
MNKTTKAMTNPWLPHAIYTNLSQFQHCVCAPTTEQSSRRSHTGSPEYSPCAFPHVRWSLSIMNAWRARTFPLIYIYTTTSCNIHDPQLPKATVSFNRFNHFLHKQWNRAPFSQTWNFLLNHFISVALVLSPTLCSRHL